MNISGKKYCNVDGAGKPRETAERFLFDGRPFDQPPDARDAVLLMHTLEMVYRARSGDDAAKYTLDALWFFMKDANGKVYWPDVRADEEAPALFCEPDTLPFNAEAA